MSAPTRVANERDTETRGRAAAAMLGGSLIAVATMIAAVVALIAIVGDESRAGGIPGRGFTPQQWTVVLGSIMLLSVAGVLTRRRYAPGYFLAAGCIIGIPTASLAVFGTPLGAVSAVGMLVALTLVVRAWVIGRSEP